MFSSGQCIASTRLYNQQIFYITVTGSDPGMENNVYDRIQRHASYRNVSRWGLYPTRSIGSFHPVSPVFCVVKKIRRTKTFLCQTGTFETPPSCGRLVPLSPPPDFQFFREIFLKIWLFWICWTAGGFTSRQKGGCKRRSIDVWCTCYSTVQYSVQRA